jgi:hypothetical protein
MIIWARIETEPNYIVVYVSTIFRERGEGLVRVVVLVLVHTRNTPVIKPMAASEVISSGGSMSALWLGGGGMLEVRIW